MNDYLRMERVLAHLHDYGTGNKFYQNLLGYYRLHGTLTMRQVESVEKGMREDTRIRQERALRDLREWNTTH